MDRRSVIAGLLAVAALNVTPARAQSAKTTITLWHALSGVLGEEVNRVCQAFNASQSEVEIQALFRGTYAETMTQAVAAFRAGQAPNLVQVFEVGTGTMLNAGEAVVQVWDLSQRTGIEIDPERYIPAVRGYYSLPDGRLASAPWNSSTAIMYYNKDAFEKAGLDPEKAPATWPEVLVALEQIKSKGTTPGGMTTAWPTWVQVEQYSAIHNVPFATEANGFNGWNAELTINSAAHVKHIQRLLDMAKAGLFTYGGRDGAAGPIFPSGQAAIGFDSSASRPEIQKQAQFRWAAAYLPYDPEIIETPINSVIGGASLWPMNSRNRTPEQFAAVAKFIDFLAKAETDAEWAQDTGYVPVTIGGSELMKTSGFFDKNPGTEVPVNQLLRGEVTDNSRGFRLGRMPEIRNIIQEELERALQGQQSAQQAMDTAVQRGNTVLRQFERTVRA
jgi:sn-glycerol 3-phosphate transport system substrate-binding protein